MITGTASQHEAGDTTTGPVRVGQLVADKYLIERTLGVGGMGVVVAARDQVLDRRVAIKFLLPKLAGSDTAVQRFVREARAATRISSEHVVRLLEIEKLPSGTPFFVMEYLEGSDLRGLLRDRGALDPKLAVDYVLQALQAVAEGHVRGVVHRDIKPGNLFLTARADGTPLIKVLDFGIAKTVESDAAESTALTSSDDVRLGSPAYMPPEQLQNPRDVDTRSDIWSMGATLYELICGRPAFEGPGYLELATRILSQPPSPLSERPTVKSLPDGLERVIRKCLEKERSQRYRDAAELAAALAPFGSDDAQMSLTRVRGTLSSMSSLPALVRSVASDGGTCETTMPVPTDPAPPRDVRSETGNVRTTAAINPASARGGRAWWAIAVVVVVAIGAVALRSLEPRGEAAPGISKLEPQAAVAAAFAPPVVAAPSAVTAPNAVLAPNAAPNGVAAPSAASVAAIAPVSAAVAARAERRHAAVAAAKAVPSAEAAAANARPEAPAAVPTPAPSTGGRSAEIERLIERRR